MLEQLQTIGRNILFTIKDLTLVKVQLGFMALVIAVIVLLFIVALICAVIVKKKPEMKQKIFNFIEKL